MKERLATKINYFVITPAIYGISAFIMLRQEAMQNTLINKLEKKI